MAVSLRRVETSRLEAFSDGVFAIAITLLILEVRLPSEESGTLTHRLGEAWPGYVGFFISFITIGIMWINHHSIFHLIGRTSHGLLVANLLLLMCVSFLPFPTKVLSEQLRVSGTDREVATLFYSGSFMVTACFYNLLWQTAARGNRLIAAGAEGAAAEVTRAFRWGVPTYLGATLAAFISVPLSLAVDAGLALFYLLPRRD
jgi:TMEM175 potassium channel family protein